MVSDSDRKVSDGGKYRNNHGSYRNLVILTSENFLSDSDAKDSNNLRQDPVGILRILSDPIGQFRPGEWRSSIVAENLKKNL